MVRLSLACLNYLTRFSTVKSNPFWESYEPAPGNLKPLPRSNHASVTTGDHIIMFVSLSPSPCPLVIMFCRFGGYCDSDPYKLNDTWSFNILTRKWIEIRCTGSIPSPRAGHTAALVNDVMYIYGGVAIDGTYICDLTALNLPSK